MTPNPELDALHIDLFDRMVQAQWLDSYVQRDGGFHLVWTMKGTEIAICLGSIIELYGLNLDDRAPLAFNERANGRDFPGLRFAGEIDPEVGILWNQCLDSLRFGEKRDQDRLLVFVHAIVSWGPDEDTRIRFGSEGSL